MLSHRALLANIEQVAQVEPLMITGQDVVMGVLPLFHVYGLNAVLGQLLIHQARMVLVEGFDPEGALGIIEDEAVTVLPVAADGRLGAPSAVVKHSGSSVNTQRQAGPHAHCTTFDPAYGLLFVCDLGLDQVLAYELDSAKGTLTAHNPPSAAVKPGSGPRHMDFRPDGRFTYVLNELTSTVTTFAYDAKAGSLTERQTVSTLPPSFTGSNSGAEIVVHPSGKFVYSSNRGHNSVALFRIDPAQGTLTFVAAQDTGGRTPRNFAIDPTGRLLFAANQDSGTMMVFTIDQASGQLKASGAPVAVPAPVCVRFLPPRTGR